MPFNMLGGRGGSRNLGQEVKGGVWGPETDRGSQMREVRVFLGPASRLLPFL